jgi:hypothetical protein
METWAKEFIFLNTFGIICWVPIPTIETFHFVVNSLSNSFVQKIVDDNVWEGICVGVVEMKLF